MCGESKTELKSIFFAQMWPVKPIMMFSRETSTKTAGLLPCPAQPAVTGPGCVHWWT